MITFGWISVWKRNRDVFLKLFLVNFFLPLLEPLFYLFAFGYGLGGFVKDIDGVPYKTFILPAIISMAALSASFFYTTYSSFVKMIFQKTFDAIIATPVGIEDVVVGEIMWGATRGAISGVMVSSLFVLMGLISVKTALLYLPFILVLSFTFSSLGMLFTAVINSIEAFNYPIFLYFTPMIFFSGTFFPLKNMPEPILLLTNILFPLSLSIETFRAVPKGVDVKTFLTGLLPLLHGIVYFIASIKLMRKKLIK